MRKVKDTNDEYHASELLGTSTIVSGYDSKSGLINLAKVKAQIDGRKEVSNSLKKIFDYGTVQHSVILEQDTSELCILPEFAPIPVITGKDQKDAWLAENPDKDPKDCPKFKPIPSVTAKAQLEAFKAENPAKYYLKESEYKNILGAFDVISSQTTASEMISNALEVETSFYDDEEGLKVRPDLIGESGNGGLFVCNYKTINDLSKCNSHIYHLNYDLRAVQEMQLVSKYYKKPVDAYYFLFQEKTSPYSIRCFKISDIDLEVAVEQYEKCKAVVKFAKKENYFPQPAFEIEETSVYRVPRSEDF